MPKPDCSSQLIDDAEEIWKAAIVIPMKKYEFKVGQDARRHLESIIGIKKCSEIFKDDCCASVNRKLRKFLQPLLKRGSRSQRIRIARWIVRDWGGIRRGVETIDSWVDCLDDFSLKSLNHFAQDMAFKRIASWSKILAFVDPKHHAIYDARVAASLNCGLVAIKSGQRFYQPRSQNSVIKKVHHHFRPCTCGYFDYIQFLKAVVKTKKSSSILEAEMTLFAGAVARVERLMPHSY